MDYKEQYLYWTEDDSFDQETKTELKAIAGDDGEIKERFHKELEFGTGGLRGILGAGTNRMNIYTVRKATQGFANYLKKQDFGPGKKVEDMGVCIAYDSRRMSPEFAKQTALVLNGNGIKAYVFDELRPTPELSFAVRHLGCAGGVVITASHNPPEYNGYKVYGEDGGQVPFPKDGEIILEVNQVGDYKNILVAEEAKAIADGLYQVIGVEVDDAYTKNVMAQCIRPDIIKTVADKFSIVYTPLHGTGNKPVRRVLSEAGFKNVHVVAEQELPDSQFTTVGYPNPEDPKAFKLAMALGDEVGADILIGTDPDADRVGVVAKNSNGEYVVFTGNMIGVLLTDYIITQKKENSSLPDRPAIVSTIVSTNMTRTIAEKNDVAYFEVLTGFKYIGEKIKEFEKSGDYEFIFGFEESYGCLAGTYARDKDAVGATLLVCEMAAYYKSKGITLYEGLQALYEKYGYFMEKVESITLKGIEGSEKIKIIMNGLRENPPKIINGKKIGHIYDYAQSVHQDLYVNVKEPILLPKSNVLYYTTEDNSWLCVRPSGTEPKIKVYFGVQGTSAADGEEKLKGVIADTMAAINQYLN